MVNEGCNVAEECGRVRENVRKKNVWELVRASSERENGRETRRIGEKYTSDTSIYFCVMHFTKAEMNLRTFIDMIKRTN